MQARIELLEYMIERILGVSKANDFNDRYMRAISVCWVMATYHEKHGSKHVALAGDALQNMQLADAIDLLQREIKILEEKGCEI